MQAFQGQAPLQRLFLQDMSCEQLSLCISQRFELCADIVTPVIHRRAVDDPRGQHKAKPLGQQNQLQCEPLSFSLGLLAGEADTAFGQYHRLRCALIFQQILRQCLAQKFDSFVLHLQVVGQCAIALGNLPQQMLRFEIELMQLAEQAEKRR